MRNSEITNLIEQRDRLGEFSRYVIKIALEDEELDTDAIKSKALELGLVFKDIATESDRDEFWYVEPGKECLRIQEWLTNLVSVTGID